MPDLPPSPIGPKFLLRIAIIDGDVIEYPYASAMDAKHELEIIHHGMPGGLWAEDRYYPLHRIEYAEITPAEMMMPKKKKKDKEVDVDG